MGEGGAHCRRASKVPGADSGDGNSEVPQHRRPLEHILAVCDRRFLHRKFFVQHEFTQLMSLNAILTGDETRSVLYPVEIPASQ